MNPNNKKYGLIVPKKELAAPTAGNVFGDEESDEETGGVNWVERSIKAEAEKHRSKKQTKLNVQRALEVDPTIFQYDEIYDDMEKSKQAKEVSAKKQDRKPKYIHNIKKAAELRKIENERRIERVVQKERDAEGDMYKDKEVFVTATHRANLEKMRQRDEEEARIDRLESIADVTKQPDISGFYRHLYSQTVDKKPTKEEKDSTDESPEPGASTAESLDNIDRDEDLSVDSDYSEDSQSDSGSGSEKTGKSKAEAKKSFAKSRRQYRSRNVEASEESEDEGEGETKAKVKKSEKKRPRVEDEAKDKKDEPAVEVKKDSIEEKEREDSKKDLAKESKVKVEKEKIVAVPKEEIAKVSIWEKRTVGDAFDAAVQRYYTRKALRMSS